MNFINDSFRKAMYAMTLDLYKDIQNGRIKQHRPEMINDKCKYIKYNNEIELTKKIISTLESCYFKKKNTYYSDCEEFYEETKNFINHAAGKLNEARILMDEIKKIKDEGIIN